MQLAQFCMLSYSDREHSLLDIADLGRRIRRRAAGARRQRKPRPPAPAPAPDEMLPRSLETRLRRRIHKDLELYETALTG